MNERIKELMNQTGVPVSMPFDKWCEKFAELVRTDEREACAVLCENMERNGAWITKEEAAAAIRARGVDAVNTSQERVDETAKGEHEPWPSVQCVCGGTIYFKYTPPVSDYHEGWEEGFKAGKREWVGLTDEEVWDLYTDRGNVFARAIETLLKEKNGG